MRKRILSFLLALTILCNVAPVAFAATAEMGNFKKVNTYTSGQFTDVKLSDWFSPSVQSAYEMGLVKGNSATTYNPTGDVTIAETLALASRIHNIYHGGNGQFLQETPWYQVYVDYATSMGIIKVAYDYAAKATRAQFAEIIAASMPEAALPSINSIGDDAIPDVKTTDAYGAAVYRLYRAGILTGSDAYGTFNPHSNIQRSEVAAILARMTSTAQRKVFTMKTPPGPATGITIDTPTLFLYVGDTYALTATVQPDNAIDKTVTWYSSNPNVVTVSPVGVVIAVSKGEAFVSAQTVTGAIQHCKVTVMSDDDTSEKDGKDEPVKELNAEQVYEKCAPAVFFVKVYDRYGSAFATGSGFFIDESGIAVTNYHVIEVAYSATIHTSDTQREYDVVGVIDYNEKEDWAVIQIDGSGFPVLDIGDPTTVVGGATVYALGSPLGLQNSISQGIISNTNRVEDGATYIQITAAISSGSSGGALINKYGDVIGITSATYTKGQNLNLAVPITAIEGYDADSVTPLGGAPKPSGGSSTPSGTTNQAQAFDALKAFIVSNANSSFGTGNLPTYGETIRNEYGNHTLKLVYNASKNQIDIVFNYDNTCTSYLTLTPNNQNYAISVFVYLTSYSTDWDFFGQGTVYAPSFTNDTSIPFTYFEGASVKEPTISELCGNMVTLSVYLTEEVLNKVSGNYSMTAFGFTALGL